MQNELFWDILDEQRTELLPAMVNFKDNFYLAGGTALALQLGHRDSIDFDFFTQESFSTGELFEKLNTIFSGHKIEKTQGGKDTLSVLIDGNVKMSFFTYPYALVRSLINTEYFKIASVEDIGLMKLSAITSRSVMKDYVDLYFIFQKMALSELMDATKEKFPSSDQNLILKSLVYFDDIIDEPIIYKHGSQTDPEVIKNSIREKVKEYLGP